MELQQTSLARRAASLGAVILAHILLLVLLSTTGTIPPVLPHIMPIHMIPPSPRKPPPPPPVPDVTLPAPPPAFIPLPEITLAAPPPDQPVAPRAITRAAPSAHPASHFGAASDAGLGLDVGAASGGGAGTRGTLAGFEAAVRARVLARKHQPVLGAERRQTCVVNYTVTVTRGGGLASLSIDPCAIAEINEAARAAIRAAAPFPLPPDLGAATTEVHGSLIFHP